MLKTRLSASFMRACQIASCADLSSVHFVAQSGVPPAGIVMSKPMESLLRCGDARYATNARKLSGRRWRGSTGGAASGGEGGGLDLGARGRRRAGEPGEHARTGGAAHVMRIDGQRRNAVLDEVGLGAGLSDGNQREVLR